MKPKYPWSGWHIAAADAALIWVSFLVSYVLRYELEVPRQLDEAFIAPFTPFIPYTFLFMCWVLLVHQSAQLYEEKRERTLVNELFIIANATSNAAIFVMALSFLLRPLLFSRLVILQAAVITVLILGLWRIAIRVVRSELHKRGIGIDNVLVVGAGEQGRGVIGALVARPDLGYRLVGFVTTEEQSQRDLGRVQALGTINNLASLVDQYKIDLVIVTLPWDYQHRIFDIVETCERNDVAVRVVPDLFQLNMAQVEIENLGGMPLIGAKQETRFSRGNLIAKRVMDVTLTLLGLPFILPLMGLTALAIRMESSGPVLFYQTRVGFNGRIFRMVKFRSMIENAEELESQVVVRTEDDPEGKFYRQDDDPRITAVGRFIRRTSIDELPQLFNVLRGEMSLVGPRPALPEEIALYKPWQRQRLLAPPGITGLWQVSGRADLPFDEKCLLDIYYIANWSIGIDLQILLQTLPQIFWGKGAY